MKVPFLDLSRTTQRILNSAQNKIMQGLESCSFVGGTNVEFFEKKLSDYLGGIHCIACANGTDALIIALQAMGVHQGMYIGVPNITFWASYEAIIAAGCIPVLIDINPIDLQLDLHSLKEVIKTTKLHGIIIAHLYGWCSHNLFEIRELCRENEIICIEDGAQAFGVKISNNQNSLESVFQSSTISTLSFYPSKVLGGCMDGGAILTKDKSIADLCKILRDHGRSGHYTYSHVGWNSRMSGTQALWLTEAIDLIDTFISERVNAFNHYQSLLRGHGPYRLVTNPQNTNYNGYLMVIELEDDVSVELLVPKLLEKGISTGRVYPTTLHQQPPAKGALQPVNLARSTKFCTKVINLPLFPGITSTEIEHASESFLNCLKKNCLNEIS